MKKIILILFYFILSFSAPVWAQIFTEQGKIVHQVAPGQTISGSLMIHNTSNQSIPVKDYWEDFRYEPPFNGSKKFFPPGTLDASLSRWISFLPKQFTLAPYGKQKINYTINVPAEAKGGYYGVLFFEPESQNTKTSTGIRIITRVGSLFFLETSNKVKKAGIDNIKLKDSNVQAELTNKGNVILIPTGTFYIMNSANLVVDRGEIPALYLPSSQKGNFQFDFKKDLPEGQYTIVLTLDLQEGDVLVKEVDFEKHPPADYKIIKIRD